MAFRFPRELNEQGGAWARARLSAVHDPSGESTPSLRLSGNAGGGAGHRSRLHLAPPGRVPCVGTPRDLPGDRFGTRGARWKPGTRGATVPHRGADFDEPPRAGVGREATRARGSATCRGRFRSRRGQAAASRGDCAFQYEHCGTGSHGTASRGAGAVRHRDHRRVSGALGGGVPRFVCRVDGAGRGRSEKAERRRDEQAARSGRLSDAAQHPFSGTGAKPDAGANAQPQRVAGQCQRECRQGGREAARAHRCGRRRQNRGAVARTIRRLPTSNSVRRRCANSCGISSATSRWAILPRIRKSAALRRSLVELERQIAAQRDAGQRNTLAQAREELTSAQGVAMRIQNQIAKGQKDLGQFTARLNEYKAQQDQLNAVDTAYQDASRRLAKLDATVRARTTTLKLLDPPSTPQQPWRPNYWRDTAVCLGASLVLALLAMGLVELFNRSEPRPGVVVLQAQSGGLPSATAQHTLGWQEASAIPLAARAPALLQQAPTFPRELSPDEVASLVQGSDDDSRLAVLLLLSGVSPDEALALRWSDVDLAGNRIHVGGLAARDVALHDSLRAPFAARAAGGAVGIRLGPTGSPGLARHGKRATPLRGSRRRHRKCDRRHAGLSPAYLCGVSRSSRYPVRGSDAARRPTSRRGSGRVQYAFAHWVASSPRGDQRRFPRVPVTRIGVIRNRIRRVASLALPATQSHFDNAESPPEHHRVNGR